MASDCGCAGDVAPVSYESDCAGCGAGRVVEGAVDGCVGDGCGEPIYESGDTVIESSETPVEAPAVEAADDKEA